MFLNNLNNFYYSDQVGLFLKKKESAQLKQQDNAMSGGKYAVNTGQAKDGGVALPDFSGLVRHRPKILAQQVRSFVQESTLRGHKKAVYACKFEPLYGDLLATCSHDMSAIVWDIRNGQQVRTLKEHAGWVMDIAWTNDGNFLLTASADKTIMIWSTRKTFVWSAFAVLHTFSGHTDVVMGITVSPDNTRMLSCSKDKTIKVWDLKRATQNLLWKEGNAAQVYTIKGAPENYDGHSDYIFKIVFSPDGQQFLTCSEDLTIKRWNAATGDMLMNYTGHREPVLSVAWRYDLTFFASASHDKTVKMWDVENGRCASTLKGHKDIVYDVKFSGECNKGRLLVSCGHDGRVIVWDAKKRLELVHYVGMHRGWVLSIDWSKDNYRLATGAGDHKVIVWVAHARSCGECCHECCFDCKRSCSLCC